MATENLDILIRAQNEASRVAKQVNDDLQNMEATGVEGNEAIGDSAESAGLSFGKMAAAVAAAAVAIGAAIAVVKAAIGELVQFIGEGITAAGEFGLAVAQLESVLASTGMAAGLTKQELLEMADALAGASLNTQDMLVDTQALLLTFTNISKDVFPDALQAIADISQAMGTDLRAEAIRLGKALNDPILGVSALAEVGVNFTKEAKEMIRTMVEQGDVMGAQQFILRELAIEFGGSAANALETFSGKITKTNQTWELFQRRVGEIITTSPVFLALLDKTIAVLGALAGAITEDTELFGKLQEGFETAISAIIQGLASMVRAFAELSPAVIPIITVVFSQFATGVQLATTAVELFIKQIRPIVAAAGLIPSPFQNAARSVNEALGDMDDGIDVVQGKVDEFLVFLNDQTDRALKGEFVQPLMNAADAIEQFGDDIINASRATGTAFNELGNIIDAPPAQPVPPKLKAVKDALVEIKSELSPFDQLAQAAFDRAQQLGQVFETSGFTIGQFLERFKSQVVSVAAELERLDVEIPMEIEPVIDRLALEAELAEDPIPMLVELEIPPPDQIPSFNPFFENFASNVSSGFVNGLKGALSGAKSFAEGLSTVLRSSLEGLFDKALESLQSGLEGLLSKLSTFQQGLIAGALILGTALLGSKSGVESQFSSPTGGEQITSTQAVRGVVAGPTSVGIGEFSRNIFEATRPIHQTLLRMEQIMLANMAGSAF